MQNITWVNILSAVGILYLLYRVGLFLYRWNRRRILRKEFIDEQLCSLDNELKRLKNRVHGENGYYNSGQYILIPECTIEKRIELLENELKQLKEKTPPKKKSAAKGNE